MNNFDVSNLIVPGIIFAALLVLFFASNIVRKKLRAKYGKIVDASFHHLHKPVEVLLVATALFGVLQSLQLRWAENPVFYQSYVIAAIMIVCWLAIRAVQLLSLVTLTKMDAVKKDGVRARTAQAQMRILRRIGFTLIVLLGAATILMGFADLQVLGVSLLVLVGMAVFILGMAAKKTIGNFFAGMQIAMAQPVRIDDTVTVEGMRGVVEEINLTYVVLKAEGDKRLVLPVTYFTKKPFQKDTGKA